MQVLQQQVPDHGFLGEEGGVSGNANSEYLWCIDPIDGTTNFAAGYPSFGVSVAGMAFTTQLSARLSTLFVRDNSWQKRNVIAAIPLPAHHRYGHCC